jgi:hypothetical protein
MGKKIKYFLFIFLFIALDIFSRFLFKQSWFSKITLSNEVNPFDILSLIVSSVVAIWLGRYISKKLSAQRFEKEYLISDIKKIEDEIHIIENKLQSSNIELQTILDLLLKFKLYIDRFSKTINIFGITNINATKLNNYYNLLYQKTTNTESDIFNIDEAVQIEITNICSSFILETRQMIFKINKN